MIHRFPGRNPLRTLNKAVNSLSRPLQADQSRYENRKAANFLHPWSDGFSKPLNQTSHEGRLESLGGVPFSTFQRGKKTLISRILQLSARNRTYHEGTHFSSVICSFGLLA